MASVWGFSSIIGPAAGGFFVVYTNWAWVFWMNLPIGVLAILGLVLFLKEDVEKKRHDIDFVGIGLLFVSISSLMIIFVRGGVVWSWFSTPVILLFILFLIGLTAFIFQEKRALDPVVPLSIWQHPTIMIANLASLTTGTVLMGVTTFLPTYVQGVMNRSPMEAGFVLAMMSIGWPLASTLASKIMLKIGFRTTALIGGLIIVAGALFFVVLKPEYGPIWAGTGSFLIGTGMGLTTTTFIVSVQSSVDWKQRGVATASNMFMRTLGTTIGASLLGGILNTRLLTFYNQHPQQTELGLDLDLTNEVLDPDKRSNLSDEVVNIVKEGLTISLQTVYTGVLILAVISFIIIWFWPKSTKIE